MADVSAAPAAAPVSTPTPSNGATGTVTPAPKPAAPRPTTPAPAPAHRAPDGKFLPKAGAVGVAPPEEGEKPPEPEWRFKEKLKLHGKEEDVDYSREDLVRELQLARANARKIAGADSTAAKAQRLFELARANPEAFMKELGHDPDAWARQRLASEAKLNAMTQEERAIHERDARIAELEGKEKTREEQVKEWRRQVAQKKMQEGMHSKFMQGLEATGLPKTHESLYLMAETARLAIDAGRELTGEQLARETERRVETFTAHYLKGLSGASLAKKLGPELVKSLIQHSISEFEQSQNFEPKPTDPPPTPEPTDEESHFIDESELNRRMKELRRK